MATVVGVYNMAHTPFCYTAPEAWNEIRSRRTLREDVPLDDLETNQLKFERIQVCFKTLRGKLSDVRPDVVVVLGDDQAECFDFTNHPAFAVYVGDEFEGLLAPRGTSFASGGERSQRERARRKGHSQLATEILTGLMRRDFDPAFCMDMPKPAIGIGHAILRPAESIIQEQTPIVPILLNCYYAPQVTGSRSYALGRALREIIEDYPDDLRVAVVGSGGLWHGGGAPTYLDEEFDGNILGYLEAGNARSMADYFDAFEVAQTEIRRGRGSTGMPSPGGPQGGTRETCNWIAAAAVADGAPSTVIDYIPVYASPIGVAFSYCEQV